MVALGDSFISGEGAKRYLTGTGSKDNVCHRANTAYPYLVAKNLDYRLVTAACSGAVTDDVIRSGQHPHSPSDVLGGRKQLEVLDRSDLVGSPADIDVLVLSIGGNDAGFGDIVRTCLDEKNCQRHDVTWMARLENVAPALKATYDAIAAKVPQARRIVMTYPQTMVPTQCAPGLAPGEVRWVNNRFLPRLDSIITFQASLAGFEVVDNTDSFAGARVCEDGELTRGRAANVFSLERVHGRFGLDPAAITRGSFHPTEIGHALLAARLLSEVTSVAESPDPCGAACPPAPPPNPPTLPPDAATPFPQGTDCVGDSVASDKVLRLESSNRSVQLPAVTGSRYCFRNWEEAWRSKRATDTGAGIFTKPIRDGEAISVEVLTEAPSDSWTRTVLIPASADFVGKATLLDHLLFGVLLVGVLSLLVAALPWFMAWWHSRSSSR